MIVKEPEVVWTQGTGVYNKYRGTTFPARWASLVHVEAAQTTWTGSDESQTSVAESVEDSLHEQNTECESGELLVDDIT